MRMNSALKNETSFNQKTHNLIRIKRTCLILILCCIVQLINNKTYSQSTTCTLNMKDVTVEQVLNAIESKTVYRFLFNKEGQKMTQKSGSGDRNCEILIPDHGVMSILV